MAVILARTLELSLQAAQPFPLIEVMEQCIKAEEASGKPVSFHRLEMEMHRRRNELALPEIENSSAWADAVAFGLETDHYQEPWNLFFGPRGWRGQRDGEKVFIPEVRELDERACDLWAARLEVVKHPAFRARYSDILWECAEALGRRRNPDHARSALAAYEAMIVGHAYEEFFEKSAVALRMLTLALSIRDDEARQRARDLLMEEYRRLLDTPGGFNFEIVERLLWERNVGTPEITAEIVAGLEAALAESAVEGPKFNPHFARDIATRLQRHHKRERSRDDVRRVQRTVAAAFEALASRSEAMVAAAHLDVAATEYRNAGEDEAFSRVRAARADAVARSNAEMAAHSFEFKITFDDMERFLDGVIAKDDAGASLARIAYQFIPSLEVLRERVLQAARSAPLQASININIHEDEHIAAVVGSVEDDLEGRVMLQAGQDVMLDGIFLREALERCITIHELDPHHIAGWANRLGAFDDLTMVMEGVTAWLCGDFIKALHVLVPQIELGLRKTLKSLEQPVVRNHPTMVGRQILLNMGEVLATPALQAAFGDDTIHYFRSLYVDPRARNLRNVMAHGLTSVSDASTETCDRLIHSLLVFGCWMDIAASRNAAANPGDNAPTAPTRET